MPALVVQLLSPRKSYSNFMVQGGHAVFGVCANEPSTVGVGTGDGEAGRQVGHRCAVVHPASAK